MGWTVLTYLAICLAGLYVLGLVLYRLFLSLKSLARAISQTQALLSELLAYEPVAYTPAEPTSRAELAEALLARRRFEKGREAKAQARQRRLLKRIGNIEMDKR